jgi:hypothetical protein
MYLLSELLPSLQCTLKTSVLQQVSIFSKKILPSRRVVICAVGVWAKEGYWNKNYAVRDKRASHVTRE